MRKCAVVTGASSGIGAATVRRLSTTGWDVVAVARREPQLTALANETGCETAVLDVTDAAAVAAFASELSACDALINVAGGSFDGDSVAEGDPESWLATFRVNVMGTLIVTQALMGRLRDSSSATIVNITSTAAYVNYENGGSYTAAKHAEHSLTETLRLELSGAPIRVIEIAPGMVKTEEFALNRFSGDAEKAAAVYKDVDRPLTADDVAECIGWATELPIHVNVDRLVVRPLAQAAQHKVFRGQLFGA
jgi:NADP-dependent 3-hydroxy acid dehydrogenase YdfG